MKVLLTSDLHVGLRNKNEIKFIDFSIDYINYIENYCIKNKIDYIFFLGDLLEKSSNVRHEYFTPLFRKLEEINKKIKLFYILGNHDIYTKENDSLVEVFPGKIIKFQENIKINNIDFCFLSFTDKVLPKITGDYLMTHIPIESFKMDNYFVPKKKFYPINLFKDFKKVFSGHYHLHQKNKNIVYLGSPFQMGFNEENSKTGFVVLDTDIDDWKFVEYRRGPKFKVINKYKKMNLKNTFIKLKINNDNSDFHIIKNKLFMDGALSVEVDLITEKKENINENQNIKLDNSLKETIIKFLKEYKQDGVDNKMLLKIFEKAHEELHEV